MIKIYSFLIVFFLISSAFSYEPVIDLKCESTEKCSNGFNDIGLGLTGFAIVALPYWIISRSNPKVQHQGYLYAGGGTHEVKEVSFGSLSQLNELGLLYASDFKMKVFGPTRSGELQYSLGTGWSDSSSLYWSYWITTQLAALKYGTEKDFQFGLMIGLGARYNYTEKKRIVAQIQQTRYSYDVSRFGLGLEFGSPRKKKMALGHIGFHLFHEDNQLRDNQLWIAAIAMAL